MKELWKCGRAWFNALILKIRGRQRSVGSNPTTSANFKISASDIMVQPMTAPTGKIYMMKVVKYVDWENRSLESKYFITPLT